MDEGGRPGVDPNPMMRALWEMCDGQWSGTMPWVEKVQPPDGMIVVLPDGTRWGVMAHRVADAPVPDSEVARRAGNLRSALHTPDPAPGTQASTSNRTEPADG